MIPTLQDDEVTVWESEAVLRYLAGRYGLDYFPADPAERAQIDQWLSWVQSTWAPAMTAVFAGHVRLARADRNSQTEAAQIARLHAVAGLVEEVLGSRSHLARETLSLADFAFGAFLYRYYTLEIDRPALPRLAAYYDRLCERPAFCEHVQVEYDSLRIPGAERPNQGQA